MHTDVIRHVAGLVRTHEKQAGLGSFAVGMLRKAPGAAKSVFGAGKNLLGAGLREGFTRPKAGFGTAGRELSAGRAAATLGGGAFAGGHINNAMSERGLTPEQIFAKHKATYGQQAQGLQQKIDAANSAGNFGMADDKGSPGAEALNEQMMADDFGGDWSFGGLNPFADRGAAYQKQRMQGATEQLHSEHAGETQKYLGERRGLEEQAKKYEAFLARPGLDPAQQQAIRSSLQSVKQRLSAAPGGNGAGAEAIVRRLQTAGMPLPQGAIAPAQGGPPQGGGPSPAPSAIPSTQATAGDAGRFLNPNDFRVRPTF